MDKETNYKKINETHQIENARRKKRRRRRMSYVFLILIMAFSFSYLCYRYLFRINTVEYVGNERYSDEILSEKFGVKSGDRLFSYSKKEKEEMILRAFPYLAECEIKRSVPDKITVSVVERKGAMFTFAADRYLIFDDEMYVVEISSQKPQGLLEVCFDDEILVKCILGEEIIFNDKKTGVGISRAYEAISQWGFYENIKKLEIKSRFDFYLDYDGRYEVYLGDSKEIPAKLLFLDGIVKKLGDEKRGRIDISNPKEGFFKEEK